MKRKKSQRKFLFIAFIAIAIIVLALILAIIPYQNVETRGLEEIVPRSNTAPYHIHADFLVVINSKELNFNRDEYSETNPGIHLHVRNYNGDKLLHVESSKAVLGHFFSSIGIEFSNECFNFVDGEAYCNNLTHSLRFFVNGNLSDTYEKYKPKDLDKLLIIYGNETEDETKKWIDAVSNVACIFSMKCSPPEGAENDIIYN